MKVKEFYTAAELDAMDAETDRKLQEEAEKLGDKAMITVAVAGQEMTLEVPEVFRALSAALPIVTSLFGFKKTSTVLADDLFSKIGGTYKKGAWINRVVADCKLEEHRDFVQVAIDRNDPANAHLLVRGQRETYATYFTTKAASKIIIRSGSDDAHVLFDYMYAVTELATPRLLAQLDEVKGDLRLISKKRDQFADEVSRLSKKAGFKNATQMQVEEQEEAKLRRDDTTKSLEMAKSLMLQRGIQRMRGSKWNATACESLFEVVERELARAEREGDCLADPF